MTDTQDQPPAETAESVRESEFSQEAPPPPPPASKRRDMVPWLYGLGFVVLAGAMVYLWQNPANPAATGPSEDMQALSHQVETLESRIAQLEQRPAAVPTDLSPLSARLDALERRPAADPAPLANRLALLEQKASGDTQVAGRVDALAGRLEALSGKDDSVQAELTRQIEAEGARIAALEKTSGQMSGIADRAGKLARIQAATTALAAGRPLGEIPGAPPALARYVAVAPPTEAALRLSYPAAERAALAVTSPETEGKPFLDRVLARAQDLVTVRQGDHVIIGDEGAGILARARTALMAGDLPAAAAAVADLHGAPAKAMADWLAQAQALLAARAALADLAAHA
jgi:hypothetical protein